MELTFRPAEKSEYESVRDFYYELIDKMQFSEYHPKWQKGIYPEDGYLKSATDSGQLYIALSGGRIISAMIINNSTTEGYDSVSWPTSAKSDETAVIHALGVMPDFSRRGVGRFMVNEAIKVASEQNCRVIRLDVLKGNLPAEKLYKSMGFSFIQRVELFYEDTGLCDFDLYEYVL